MNEHTNSLLERMLMEQERQNELLTQIVSQNGQLIGLLMNEGMSEGDVVVSREREPACYLDGSPCL
ncbi:hypothetical protein ACI2KS_23910 [Pseudomonas sp. NPDC087358]|uniref:hypothetical protein n=1 Tax=Pseudomonas sp. NPDC087358 TaxID=3364439 RepID=UPI00384B14AC